MAYGKSYKYNRKNYRKSKNFSRFNLYRKRSAKSQALQLYNLNKKVMKIKRDLSPDIVRWEGDNHYEYTNSTISTHISDRIALTDSIRTNLPQTQNKLTIRGGKIYGVIRYADDENIETASEHHNHSGSIRFILVKTRSERSNMSFGISDVLTTASIGSQYMLNTVRPLREGCGSFLKILYDKTYIVSDDYNVKRFFIKIPGGVLKRLAGSTDVLQGEYFLFIVSSGLQSDLDFTQHLQVNIGWSVYYNKDEI